MDEIAALARVSKQTVYKHFAHKEQLFVEIVTTTVNQIGDAVHEEVLNLADSGDIQGDLRDLACRLLNGVKQPRLLKLRRLVIGEAGRFPQLGRTFYERGPGRTIATLATAFERLAARDVLRLEDPELAANHFNWLIMSTPLNRARGAATRDGPSRSARGHRVVESLQRQRLRGRDSLKTGPAHVHERVR
jgi:TetR/AcrR family transcriptional repressor of mexJK operon